MFTLYTLHVYSLKPQPTSHTWCAVVHVQLDVLLNGRVVDALASVVHRDKAYSTGKTICLKLKDTIHRSVLNKTLPSILVYLALVIAMILTYKKILMP